MEEPHLGVGRIIFPKPINYPQFRSECQFNSVWFSLLHFWKLKKKIIDQFDFFSGIIALQSSANKLLKRTESLGLLIIIRDRNLHMGRKHPILLGALLEPLM